MRTVLGLLIVCTFAACGARGTIQIAPTHGEGATEHQIYVATTRQSSQNGNFSSLRTSRLSYARYDVSIPPTHKEGKIEWPKGTPDPATDFVATQITPYKTTAGFAAALSQSRAQNSGAAVIYIHGFNTTFAEGVYRLAQLNHDMAETDTAIHYSWPATQKTLQYTRDRDSVLFARDGLESLLDTVSNQGFNRIFIVAHSIGSHLVMETLRQISLQNDKQTLQRIDGVVLISPDIDKNLFETQIRRINPLPHPFIVFGDEADIALKVSALLTGRAERVGQLKNTDQLRKYGVQFVNVTDIKDGDGALNHSVPITSPTMLSILRQLPEPRRDNVIVDSQFVQNLIDSSTR